MTNIITVTQNIALRYFRKGDNVLVHEYYSDRDCALYLARKPYKTIAKTMEVLSKYSHPNSLSQHAMSIWLISQRQSEQVIGCITCEQTNSEVVLHIGIRKNFQGRGIASQALKVAAAYWLTLRGIDKVVSYTDIEHLAALRAYIKAGFVVVGTKESYYIAPQLTPNRRTVNWLEYTSDT